MRVGQIVTVTDVHEKKLVRRIVAVEDGFAYVSRLEEIDNSIKEGREPNCIGFRLSDVNVVESQNNT